MSLDAILVLVSVLCLVVAAAAGVYSYFRSPRPYLLLLRTVLALIRACWPSLRVAIKRAAKPHDPETQAKLDSVRRGGGEWDNFRKRERDR